MSCDWYLGGLIRGNLYSLADLGKKKIMNKGKIDKPFFFIITEMVPFVTWFFYIFNLFFSMDGCINNGRKKSFLSYNIELSVMNKNKEFDRQ